MTEQEVVNGLLTDPSLSKCVLFSAEIPVGPCQQHALKKVSLTLNIYSLIRSTNLVMKIMREVCQCGYPNHCQTVCVIVSTLPDPSYESFQTLKLRNLPTECFLEVSPLIIEEVQTIVDGWLKNDQRRLQPEQYAALLDTVKCVPNGTFTVFFLSTLIIPVCICLCITL